MENQLIEDFKKKVMNKSLNNQKNLIYNTNNTPNNNTNINVNTNVNTNINSNPLKYIYDEEFISSINSLSTSIKNYFQNNKLYLGNIKLISENINEQTLFSKSVINDILLYFNQITKTRYNNVNVSLNINEKYIKDKMKLINERIEKINEFKISMLQNIKNCELAFLSFYEEAKNLFKKMKVIRTEKIENLNKKIIVNKNNNNINNNNLNNLSFNKHRTISHSPSHKSALINNNINNNKSKLIHKKNDNKNSTTTTNTKIISTLKYNNNNRNNNTNTNSNNEDLNEIKNMKIRYIELLQENKKLKEDLSKLNKSNNSRQKKKVNTVCSGTPSKEISAFVKRCTSATKKKYIQKPLSIGNLNNKIKKMNKSNSHSRIQTQAQTQSHITNTLSSLAEDENNINNNKLIKSIGKKSELIPIGSYSTGIEKENNILSISKNSMDIIVGPGTGVGGSFRNNTLNNTLNNNNSNTILASKVLSFLKDMKKLQENITKKAENIKELKKNFELKKRELKKYSENIVENNFSSTYGGTQLNNINNIIVENNFKVKSKEQSLKGSIESFNPKENINNNNINNTTNNNNNNNNDIIKEYEIKNKEQNNIIQNKEKEIEKLNKEIIDKSAKIENIEKDLKLKEEKIKKEKEISNLREEKLNSEKLENKKKNEEILELKNKNEKNERELKEAKDNINNLEKINNQLKEIQNQQKKLIDELNSNSKKESNKYMQLNKELELYKLNDNEIISLRNENMKLKQQITQCNSNLVTISNTNESIIHEKDKIIKNLQNNIKELNKQIDLLNNEISKHSNNLSKSTILTEEINNLRKNNDENQQKILQLQNENRQLKNRMAEIKTNYVSHDEDFNNIKKCLTELNKKTEQNLIKIKENDKKFDICSGGQNLNLKNENKGNNLNNNLKDNNINKNGDDKNKIAENCIKEIENNIGEYKLILEDLKKNSNSFIQINKALIENV